MAAGDEIRKMTNEELIEHYSDMAHLPKSEGTEHDKKYFQNIVLEMAQRFMYMVGTDQEPDEDI